MQTKAKIGFVPVIITSALICGTTCLLGDPEPCNIWNTFYTSSLTSALNLTHSGDCGRRLCLDPSNESLLLWILSLSTKVISTPMLAPMSFFIVLRIKYPFTSFRCLYSIYLKNSKLLLLLSSSNEKTLILCPNIYWILHLTLWAILLITDSWH